MKKSYAKPEVSKVKLAAEEAVLTHCKSQPVDPEGCLRGDIVVTKTIGS